MLQNKKGKGVRRSEEGCLGFTSQIEGGYSLFRKRREEKRREESLPNYRKYIIV
jgi:hypothetical protein